MSSDLREHLQRSFPEDPIEVPAASGPWIRGRRQRRVRNLVGATGGTLAVVAVIFAGAQLLAPSGPGDLEVADGPGTQSSGAPETDPSDTPGAGELPGPGRILLTDEDRIGSVGELDVELFDTAPAPIPATQDAAAVWTGEEFLVWGGGTGDQGNNTISDVGAAYDPDTDTWRTIASGPLAARSRHSAVWTGQTMFVWGGTDERFGVGGLLDGAMYDPSTDTWETIADAPRGTDRSMGQAVVVGDHIVVGGGFGPTSREEQAVLTYNLASDSWTSTIAPGNVVQLVAAGDDVAVLTSSPAQDGLAAKLTVGRLEVASGELAVLAELEFDQPPFSVGLLEHEGGLVLITTLWDDSPTQLFRIGETGTSPTPVDLRSAAELSGAIGLYTSPQHSPLLAEGSRRIILGVPSGEVGGLDLITGDTVQANSTGSALCRNAAAYAADGLRLFVWGDQDCGAGDTTTGPQMVTFSWPGDE